MKLRMFFFWPLLFCLLVLTACSGGKSTLEGWYLRSENGSSFIVTEAQGPISMSDRSRGGTLFDGLDSGDRIEITHDAIAETFPGQAGVYSCKKLEDGSFASIPSETVAILEEMGYTFGFHAQVSEDTPTPSET